jgi:hypothetical protein
MAHADDAKKLTIDELRNVASSKSDIGHWGTDSAREAARAELAMRGLDDPISADAHFIAMNASRDAGRIIKHLWIIFVLLPVVLGILFMLLTAK